MASKSKRRRKVLGASCILAALIIAGSSFAWFTSKDEVTNRLSATANYGVSIVEDFAPPENWLPGQQINKDVSVVNTGNVDAFVRTWIDGEMSVIKKTPYQDTNAVDVPTVAITLTKTADTQTKLTGVNLNWYDSNKKYYKELSQIKSKNPTNSTTDTGTANEETNDPAYFSEVQSVQAGGVLVYHQVADTNPETTPSAEYYYVLEQATTVEGYEYDTTTDPSNPAFSATKTTKTYPKGTYVCTADSCVAIDGAITNKVKIDYNYYGNIDTSQFFPETEGLYLFRRNVKLTGTLNAVDDYEYTGYYFFKDTTKSTTTATEKTDDKSALDMRDRNTYNPVYLALAYDDQHGQRSDYVLPDDAVTTNTSDPTKDEVLPVTLVDVELYTATEKVLDSYGSDPTFKWRYTPEGNLVTYTLTATNELDSADVASVVTTGDSVGTITINTVTYYVKQNKLYSSEADANSGTNEVTTVSGYTIERSQVSGTGTSGTGILSATYGTGDDTIKVNVFLSNLNNSPNASTAETWSVIENKAGEDQKWTFYYNNDVEEGATTTKLVDKVELDKEVTDEAYLAFDFDLNVFMESIQVVVNENGVESGDPVVQAWAVSSGNANAATATTNVTDNEITYISWAKS